MIGISAFGAYIPRYRLLRKSIVEANAWFDPSLRSKNKGERSICNWDEDALTMAVEACRDALAEEDSFRPAALYLGSTTAPFEDRQNGAIIAETLGFGQTIETIDIAGSLRAGTGALSQALRAARDLGEPVFAVATEQRLAKAGAPQELSFGDAAAACVISTEDVLAEHLASAHSSTDFVDHYRSRGAAFDYNWEERWLRDAGQMNLIPEAIARCLEKAGVAPENLDHLLVPFSNPRLAQSIAKKSGIRPEAASLSLAEELGDAGAAHPLLLLNKQLEHAKPNETILIVGFGQGVDALLWRVTDAAADAKPRYRLGVSGHLDRRIEEDNYQKYLAFRGLIAQEKGLRAELDKQTPTSALWRNKDTILGFKGGRCEACGTVQFPKTACCVNPNCGRFHTQNDYPMSNVAARVQSWTADSLTYTPNPPQYYGMVTFGCGGRLMMDFTDIEPGGIEVGAEMRLMFRVKDYDERRGFRRYFWKAAPA